MKLYLRAAAFVAAMVLAPLAHAQTIAAPLQVRTGDVFTVNVDYTQSAEFAEQSYDATMSFVYSIHVLDAEQRLWRFMPVSMSYQLPEMPGLDASAANVNLPAMSDLMSAMMRIATDVGFDCRVDEHGRCLEMTNWPFWSARVENTVLAFDAAARMFPTPATTNGTIIPEPPTVTPPNKSHGTGEASTHIPVVTTPASPGPNWETLRMPVLQGVARLIDGYDSVDAASSMAGLYLPAFVQGRTLTRRETTAFTDEYDMPFGAPPLRYTGTLRLDRIDRNANTATVTRRSRLDEASARASFAAMAEYMSEALVQPLAPHFPSDDQPPTTQAIVDMLNMMVADFAYDETTRGVIDLSTGLARETTTDYTVSVRLVAGDEPMQTRGRIVTRVTAAAPDVPRLPRN